MKNQYPPSIFRVACVTYNGETAVSEPNTNNHRRPQMMTLKHIGPALGVLSFALCAVVTSTAGANDHQSAIAMAQ